MHLPAALGRFRATFVASGLAAALILGTLILGGCALLPIEGGAPLRYRDDVFADVDVTSDIVYGSAVDQQGVTVSLRLDLYEPAGDDAPTRPLIVWVHGGTFRSGSKTSPELIDEANFFARKGYVNASINYRLSRNGCATVTAECVEAIIDAREDAQAAVAYLRAHAADYRIDADRIAIAGTSAGAITALGAGYYNDTPASHVRSAVSLSGAVIFTGAVDASDAPALMFHGTADALVPHAWATATLDAARAVGIEAYLVTWEGDGHVPYVEHRDEIVTTTMNFLYHTLDAAHA